MDYSKLAASTSLAAEAKFREEAMQMLTHLLLKVDDLQKQVAELKKPKAMTAQVKE